MEDLEAEMHDREARGVHRGKLRLKILSNFERGTGKEKENAAGRG